MELLRSNGVACQSLLGSVNRLEVLLNRDFLTKLEDEKSDNERFTAVYKEVENRVKTIYNHIDVDIKSYVEELCASTQKQLNIFMWIFGIAVLIVMTVLGYMVTHMTFKT